MGMVFLCSVTGLSGLMGMVFLCSVAGVVRFDGNGVPVLCHQGGPV